MKERKHPGRVNSEETILRAKEAFLKISIILLEKEEKICDPGKY